MYYLSMIIIIVEYFDSKNYSIMQLYNLIVINELTRIFDQFIIDLLYNNVFKRKTMSYYKLTKLSNKKN